MFKKLIEKDQIKWKFLWNILLLQLVVVGGYSQDIPPGVISIAESNNSIIVDFYLPAHSIRDTNIYEVYGINQTYSFVEIDGFGSISDVGYPELPQLSIDFQVPDDATNFSVSSSNVQSNIVSLSHKIIPTQECDEDVSSPTFSIDNSYYSSTGQLYAFTSKVSDPYILMNAKGITLSIFPFQYNPSTNRMTVITRARFVLTYTGTPSLKKRNNIDTQR